MARNGGKKKDREKPSGRDRTAKAQAPRVAPSESGVVAESMGAATMGPVASRPALPESRPELTDLWNEARHRRQAAPLGSPEFVQACEDVARIEVAIAAVDRAMTPPRV